MELRKSTPKVKQIELPPESDHEKELAEQPSSFEESSNSRSNRDPLKRSRSQNDGPFQAKAREVMLSIASESQNKALPTQQRPEMKRSENKDQKVVTNREMKLRTTEIIKNSIKQT